MLKVVLPSSFGYDEPVAQIVKVASRGLRNYDLQAFVKRASHQFVDVINSTKLAQDEHVVHLLAIGSTEFYGPNRNGDGFREPINKATHDTFEKFARFYRNHKNTDPDKSYGRIIKAAYNDKMHRIELLVGLNGSEKTAKANGGLVADKELEKLANGEEIPVSMACHVPFDICSGCGNRAKTRAEYCNGGQCKYGGLAINIGQTFDDGHTLHADNTEPRHFDISHVIRPADRVAYVFGELAKSASTGCISGAKLAEELDLTIPVDVHFANMADWVAREQLSNLYKLAEVESKQQSKSAWDFALTGELQLPVIEFPDISSGKRLGHVTKALAMNKVALSLPEFTQMLVGRGKPSEELSKEASAYLPGIFTRLVKSADVAQLVSDNPYTPCEELPPSDILFWAQSLKNRSLEKSAATTRMNTAIIRNVEPKYVKQANFIKTSATSKVAQKLAKQYALYKLAFFTYVNAHDIDEFPLTSTLLVRQNLVI